MKIVQLKIISALLAVALGQSLFAVDLCKGECGHEKVALKKSHNERNCHEKKSFKAAEALKAESKDCGDMGRCYLLGELDHDPVLPVSLGAGHFLADLFDVSFVNIDIFRAPLFQKGLVSLFSRPPPDLLSGRFVLLQKESFLI